MSMLSTVAQVPSSVSSSQSKFMTFVFPPHVHKMVAGLQSLQPHSKRKRVEHAAHWKGPPLKTPLRGCSLTFGCQTHVPRVTLAAKESQAFAELDVLLKAGVAVSPILSATLVLWCDEQHRAGVPQSGPYPGRQRGASPEILTEVNGNLARVLGGFKLESPGGGKGLCSLRDLGRSCSPIRIIIQV